MKIECFEDIIAWQLARKLTNNVYHNLRDCHDFGFRDQIQRASVSVMNNIAEGFERNGAKEFVRYLNISKAFCAEVRSMFYIGHDLQYFSSEFFSQGLATTDEVARILRGLISAILARHSALATRH